MKILSINSIQTFTNSKKSKAKFNNKTCSNITVSEANSNGRWFHSKCDNPSYRVYLDEKPEMINKPKIEYEYYNIRRDENGEDILTPITGKIIMQNGKVQVADKDTVYDFSGISYKKQNDELIQEVRHAKGYPFYVTEYRNGKEYKLTRYSQNSHKINEVYFFDGSFELSQKTAPQNTSTTIEFQTLNRNNEKIALSYTAVNKEGSKGNIECEIPTEDGYKTIKLNWTYPIVKYSFSGSSKDAQSLKYVLIQLKETIKSNEYKEDFGSTSYINWQLYDAIDYLGKISK